ARADRPRSASLGRGSARNLLATLRAAEAAAELRLRDRRPTRRRAGPHGSDHQPSSRSPRASPFSAHSQRICGFWRLLPRAEVLTLLRRHFPADLKWLELTASLPPYRTGGEVL